MRLRAGKVEYWPNVKLSVAFKFPYDAVLVAAVKDLVPYQLRRWHQEEKYWSASRDFWPELVALFVAHGYWPDSELDPWKGIEEWAPGGAATFETVP